MTSLKRDESTGPRGPANLLSDLPSLSRMSRRDQRILDRRLRTLSGQAKVGGAIATAANLLRASYELDKA